MSLRTILAQEGLGRIEEVWDVLYDQLRKMLRRAGYSITDLGGHKNTAIKISGHPTVTTIKFDLDRPDNRGFRVYTGGKMLGAYPIWASPNSISDWSNEAANSVDLVLDDLLGPEVKYLEERKDLKLKSQGVRFHANVYGDPTFYEVRGKNIGQPGTKEAIELWLKQNNPKLSVGKHDHGHGAWTEVSLEIVHGEPGKWFVVARYWYTGG